MKNIYKKIGIGCIVCLMAVLLAVPAFAYPMIDVKIPIDVVTTVTTYESGTYFGMFDEGEFGTSSGVVSYDGVLSLYTWTVDEASGFVMPDPFYVAGTPFEYDAEFAPVQVLCFFSDQTHVNFGFDEPIVCPEGATLTEVRVQSFTEPVFYVWGHEEYQPDGTYFKVYDILLDYLIDPVIEPTDLTQAEATALSIVSLLVVVGLMALPFLLVKWLIEFIVEVCT